ncbi:MAG TPA: PEP-CTERM sorting domain-containing protein [Phycisphaerae bacterium]|nr:PEP-CTERM sorting domain-containing protein [Phycisphaerae bacterium]
MFKRMFSVGALSLAVAVMSLAQVAKADPADIFDYATATITWQGVGSSAYDGQWGTMWEGDGNSSTYYPEDDDYTSHNGAVYMGWRDVAFDADPSISGSFTITNISPFTQSFNFLVQMPTAFATGGTTTINGASILTLNDSGGAAGATLSSVPGLPLYDAQVNLVSAQTLFNDPYSLTTTAPNLNFDLESFGPIPGPAVFVVATLGINHDFQLSPGDTMTLNSRFEIVPEPATMGLLLLGSVFILRRKIS